MKTNTKKLTPDQIRWSRKRKEGISPTELRKMLCESGGACKLSGVKMIFDAESGTPQRGGPGVHPLYASIDHIAPGSRIRGTQLVCYAINDLKGHIPHACFQALIKTTAWRSLMKKWRNQANKDPKNRSAFKQILAED